MFTLHYGLPCRDQTGSQQLPRAVPGASTGSPRRPHLSWGQDSPSVPPQFRPRVPESQTTSLPQPNSPTRGFLLPTAKLGTIRELCSLVCCHYSTIFQPRIFTPTPWICIFLVLNILLRNFFKIWLSSDSLCCKLDLKATTSWCSQSACCFDSACQEKQTRPWLMWQHFLWGAGCRNHEWLATQASSRWNYKRDNSSSSFQIINIV